MNWANKSTLTLGPLAVGLVLWFFLAVLVGVTFESSRSAPPPKPPPPAAPTQVAPPRLVLNE